MIKTLILSVILAVTYVDTFERYTEVDDVICYSGGVAQNTVINSEIRKS